MTRKISKVFYSRFIELAKLEPWYIYKACYFSKHGDKKFYNEILEIIVSVDPMPSVMVKDNKSFVLVQSPKKESLYALTDNDLISFWVYRGFSEIYCNTTLIEGATLVILPDDTTDAFVLLKSLFFKYLSNMKNFRKRIKDER